MTFRRMSCVIAIDGSRRIVPLLSESHTRMGRKTLVLGVKFHGVKCHVGTSARRISRGRRDLGGPVYLTLRSKTGTRLGVSSCQLERVERISIQLPVTPTTGVSL